MRILACLLGFALPLAAGPLTFENTTLESEVPFEATSTHVDFSFKNNGSSTVVIESCKSECPCLTAQVKGGMSIAPGKEGVIRLSMDTAALTGVVEKKAAVWLRGDPPSKPSEVLTIRAKIPELVSVEPKALLWDIGSAPEPKTAIVTMNYDKPILITSVTGADGKFTQEWKTIEEGKKYEITVTPVSTSAASSGVVRVMTDCTYPRHQARNIFAVVKPATVGAPAAKP